MLLQRHSLFRMKLGVRLLLGALLLVLLVVIWWLTPVTEWLELFRLWILRLGTLGIIAFIVIYVLMTLMVGPVSALSLTAGLVYGAWGFALVVGSATLGAAMAFLLGRYVARDYVTRWINRDIRLQSLNSAISDEGWRVVALMRLSPLIPYGIQNYLFSITRVSFVSFVLATAIGIMPATALYVYVGSLGQAIGSTGVLQWMLALAGLLATLLVAWIVGRRAKAALAVHTRENTHD